MNLRRLLVAHLRTKVRVLRKVRCSVRDPTQVFQCPACSKKYADLGLFYSHLKACSETRGRILCPECGKIVKVKSYQQHLLLHSGLRSYLCFTCGASFSQLPGLWVHMKQTHEEGTSYSCRFCGQRCRNQPQLWNHEWAHKNPQGVTCNVCQKTFRAPNLLQNHKNQSHKSKGPKRESLKPHKCEECEHRFSTRQQLVRHMVKHSKTKPFHCELCNQNFGWRRSLNAHVKQFHAAFMYTKIDYLSDSDLLIA